MKKMNSAVLMTLLLSITFSFFATSCKKEEITSQSSVSPKVSCCETGVKRAQNTTTNPYESVGIYHNDLLAEVGLRIGTVANVSQTQRLQAIYDVELESGVALPDFQQFRTFQVSFSDRLTDPELWAPLQVEEAIKQGALSTRAGAYAKSLMGLFDDLAPSSTAAEFSDQVKRLESEVLGDASLNNVDRESILQALVIARYSFEYWSQAGADPNHSWHGVILNGGGPDYKEASIFLGKLRRAMVDVGAFFYALFSRDHWGTNVGFASEESAAWWDKKGGE